MSTPEILPSDRQRFEDWYILHVFDLASSPIGSRDFTLQWEAWQAAQVAPQAPEGMLPPEVVCAIDWMEMFSAVHKDKAFIVEPPLNMLKRMLAAAPPATDGTEGGGK